MATPTTAGRGIRIRVSADTAKARQDIRKLDTSFKKVGSTAEKTTRSVARLAAGIGAAFGGALALRGVNRATDSFVDLENQVALVVGRGEELAKQMDTVYKISLATKAPVAATAESFNRLGRSLKDSGASVADINKAVISLNKAAAISGGSVESQRAALVQLGQGLASGTLRGQELNSVLEQLPRAAQAIADELGVGLGQLRAIAEEGELTSEVVFQSMLNQSEAINKEFGNIELTSGKAFILLSDQIRRLVGDLSTALGVTQTFTNAFRDMAYYIDGNRESIVQSVINARDTVKDFTATIGELANMETSMDWLKDTFSDALGLANKYLKPVEDIIRGWSDRIIGYYFNIYDEVIGNSWWTDTMKETLSLAEEYLPKVEEKIRSFANTASKLFEEVYASSKDIIGEGKVRLSVHIQNFENYRDNILKTFVDGAAGAVEKLRDMAPEIRKAITGAITTAFVVMFSSGTIVKSLTKVANKIGPILYLSLAANIVKALDNPEVFAAIGFMAGELIGQLIKNFMDALPQLVGAFFAGLSGLIVGIFKEAGVLGSVAFVTTFATFFKSKVKTVFTGLSLAKTFADALLGVGPRAPLASRIQGLFMMSLGGRRGGTSRGAMLDPAVAPFFAAFQNKKLEDKVRGLGDALRTNLKPALSSVSRVATDNITPAITSAASVVQTRAIPAARNWAKSLRRVAISAGLITAALATSASASSGGDGGGGASAALLLGAVLAGPLVESAVLKGGSKIGKAFSGSFLAGATRGLLAGVGKMFTTVGGAILATLTSTVALAAAAVAGMVAAGGLLYVAIFGEGDNISQKFKNTFDDILAYFNKLDVSTFEQSKEFFKDVERLRGKGALGTNKFSNRRVGDQLRDLNFVSLPDSEARELLKALGRIEKLTIQANSERSRYNKVTDQTQDELRKAQIELARVTEEAQASESKRGEPLINALLKNVYDLQKENPIGFTAETIVSSMMPFLLNDEARRRKEIIALIKNNDLSSGDDVRTLIENLLVYRGDLEGIFSPEVVKAFESVAGSTIDRETIDSLVNLLQNVEDEDSNVRQRALKDFEDAVLDSGNRFTKRVIAASREVAANFRDMSPFELGNISSGDAIDIANAANVLQGARNRLDSLNANGDATDAQRQAAAENVRQLEAELELAYENALQTSFRNLNLDHFEDAFTSAGMSAADAISFGLANAFDKNFSLGSGSLHIFASAFDSLDHSLTSRVQALQEYNRIIDDLSGKVQDLTDEEKELLRTSIQQREELEREIPLRAQLESALDNVQTGFSPSEMLEVFNQASQLSSVNVDLNKILAVDASTGQAIADLTGKIVALKLALQLNLGGDSSGLTALGVGSAQEGVSQLETLTKSLDKILGGFKSSGGGSSVSPIERILQGTGIAMKDLAALTAKETNKIYNSLLAIEKAERAISKSGLNNVELRKQQLDLIKNQRGVVEDILLGGSVGTAVAGGLDVDILASGPEAVETWQTINDLQDELANTRATDYETIRSITAELDVQERKLERMTESGELFESFTGGIKDSIADALKTGDFSGAFHSFADQFTSTVIDTFVGSLVDALINEESLKSAFDSLFSEDMFSGIGELFKGIFGGGSGGGIFSTLLGFFGFSQGGVVPLTPNAQVGKDSVPALLKPGERVLTTQEMRNGANRGGTQATFNINVTGDVTRQTRQEIMNMIPNITRGVNAQNHESNFKYR